MPNLSPYNPDATCPKCGFEDVATGYRPGTHFLCPSGTFVGEHLDRRCRRCQHEWAEECIAGDAERARDGAER